MRKLLDRLAEKDRAVGYFLEAADRLDEKVDITIEKILIHLVSENASLSTRLLGYENSKQSSRLLGK